MKTKLTNSKLSPAKNGANELLGYSNIEILEIYTGTNDKPCALCHVGSGRIVNILMSEIAMDCKNGFLIYKPGTCEERYRQQYKKPKTTKTAGILTIILAGYTLPMILGFDRFPGFENYSAVYVLVWMLLAIATVLTWVRKRSEKT